jgi:ubiquinone/menaquinone biosynthesis C-methylase UbiE
VCEEGDGIFDFVAASGPPRDAKAKPEGLRHLELPAIVKTYERTRPNFVRIMGRTWRAPFTEKDEDRYLETFVKPLAGKPVLDVACGAGRWTRVLAELVGTDRVIGLDFSKAMLDACRAAVPQISMIRADATRMPLAGGSMGAVNCWNALQLFEQPESVITEAARCLQPGGTFTGFTYRKATGLYEHFQSRVCAALTVRPFVEAELVRTLEAHGFEMIDVSGPALILLFAARRR